MHLLVLYLLLPRRYGLQRSCDDSKSESHTHAGTPDPPPTGAQPPGHRQCVGCLVRDVAAMHLVVRPVAPLRDTTASSISKAQSHRRGVVVSERLWFRHQQSHGLPITNRPFSTPARSRKTDDIRANHAPE